MRELPILFDSPMVRNFLLSHGGSLPKELEKTVTAAGDHHGDAEQTPSTLQRHRQHHAKTDVRHHDVLSSRRSLLPVFEHQNLRADRMIGLGATGGLYFAQRDRLGASERDAVPALNRFVHGRISNYSSTGIGELRGHLRPERRSTVASPAAQIVAPAITRDVNR